MASATAERAGYKLLILNDKAGGSPPLGDRGSDRARTRMWKLTVARPNPPNRVALCWSAQVPPLPLGQSVGMALLDAAESSHRNWLLHWPVAARSQRAARQRELAIGAGAVNTACNALKTKTVTEAPHV